MKLKLVVTLTLGLFLASCESKFEEKAPQGSEFNTENKKEYELKSKDILERLSKAQDVLVGLKAALQKVNAPSLAKFTISDLLIQVMESVKVSQAEKQGSSYMSEGDIYLNTPGVSAECRMVETRSTYTQTPERIEHVLSVRTCKTNNEYFKIANLIIAKDSAVSVSVEKDLGSILPDINSQQFLSAQNCKVEKSEERVSSIQCSASDLMISEREVLKFNRISYAIHEDPVLASAGTLMKDNEPTVNFVIEIDRKGQTYSKLTPVLKDPTAR